MEPGGRKKSSSGSQQGTLDYLERIRRRLEDHEFGGTTSVAYGGVTMEVTPAGFTALSAAFAAIFFQHATGSKRPARADAANEREQGNTAAPSAPRRSFDVAHAFFKVWEILAAHADLLDEFNQFVPDGFGVRALQLDDGAVFTVFYTPETKEAMGNVDRPPHKYYRKRKDLKSKAEKKTACKEYHCPNLSDTANLYCLRFVKEAREKFASQGFAESVGKESTTEALLKYAMELAMNRAVKDIKQLAGYPGPAQEDDPASNSQGSHLEPDDPDPAMAAFFGEYFAYLKKMVGKYMTWEKMVEVMQDLVGKRLVALELETRPVQSSGGAGSSRPRSSDAWGDDAELDVKRRRQ